MTQSSTRREWLVASALATLTACGPGKGTGFYGYALVANAGDNSLAALDLTAFRCTATIPLNAPPSRVLPSPHPTSGAAAYALTPSNGTVHVIGGNLKRVRSLRLADHLSDLGLSPDGHALFALSPHAKELIHLDPATLQTITRHRLSLAADSADFSTTGYAALASASGSVELVHLASGKSSRVQTPPLGSVRFRSDGKLLLTANVQNRSLLALDVPSLQTVAELPLAMRPDNLCFNADQGQLFVSGAGMDGVAVVFPYNTLEIDQTLLAGRAPGPMVCSSNPPFLFVGSDAGSNVCILNINTRKVIGFVAVGGSPSFLKVTPDSQYVLVFDNAKGDMGVIHVPAIRVTGEALRLKSGAALFTMLSVGSKPVDAAVIPRT